MKDRNYKVGFFISLVISSLATIPRIARFDNSDFTILLYHFIYLTFLNFIFWFVVYYFLKNDKKHIKNIIQFLIFCGFFSLVFDLMVRHIFFEFKLIYNEFPLVKNFYKQHDFIVFFLRGICYGGLIFTIEYYLKLIFDKQNTALVIEQLKKEKLEAQLASLKQQISPHFLFNSLSTLRTIVEDENSKKYINKLSNVYRYLLNLSENDLVSLKSELDFTESYSYILRERFEDALQIEMQISDNVLDRKIPPLVLQLLIENAIKHNVVSINDPLKISIKNESDTILTVTNNIKRKQFAEISTGKGLENIKTRFQLLSNKEVEFFENEESFVVLIPLL